MGIEKTVQDFCTKHEVKPADCTPLTGQVVSYLKTKGSSASAGTPSPIDFETMVNVKSKSTKAQSKQNMKSTVAAFCAKHDVTDSDCKPLQEQVVKYLKS